MVAVIVFPGHYSPCMRIVFACVNFPVDNIPHSSNCRLRFWNNRLGSPTGGWKAGMGGQHEVRRRSRGLVLGR